jgi:hypothetical protein
MKKLLCVLIPLFALAVFGCDDKKGGNTGGDDIPTLDQRLVGGRWYTVSNVSTNIVYSQGYYEFFDDPDLKMISTVCWNGSKTPMNGDFEAPVFSKDGVIWYYNRYYYKLMEYEFHDKFPNSNGFPIMTSGRELLNLKAQEGDLIFYRIYKTDGTLYDDGRSYEYWFLIRFWDYDEEE